MKQTYEDNVGGNLNMELTELEKMLRNDREQDVVLTTSTLGCSQFLTIYCC